jgi:hypothetical protein
MPPPFGTPPTVTAVKRRAAPYAAHTGAIVSTTFCSCDVNNAQQLLLLLALASPAFGALPHPPARARIWKQSGPGAAVDVHTRLYGDTSHCR